MVEHAISAWEKAAHLNPDSAETQYVLGVAYFDQEMFEEAISTLNEALRLDPERDRAYKYLGGAHYALGHDEQAISAFQTYLSLQPDDPHRESIEGMLAELQGMEAGSGPTIEYSNAEGGYILLYPKGLHYDEDHEWAVFTESPAALDAAFDHRVGDSIEESPVAMFDALSLAEMAKDFDVEETASPTEFLQAMVKSLEAETGEIQAGEVDGHPAALAEISGIYEETRYRGALAIVIVEDRVVGASTMALPDQWEAFRPTFIAMLNSLHFIDPQE